MQPKTSSKCKERVRIISAAFFAVKVNNIPVAFIINEINLGSCLSNGKQTYEVKGSKDVQVAPQ